MNGVDGVEPGKGGAFSLVGQDLVTKKACFANFSLQFLVFWFFICKFVADNN